MSHKIGPALAQPEPGSWSMKRERERVVRREDEPSFGDADVDHHDPQHRRRQQQQQSRDDVVIIVSDSDTEDEADEKKDQQPLSALRAATVSRSPPAPSSVPPAPSPSTHLP